jgi:hypothetical protein
LSTNSPNPAALWAELSNLWRHWGARFLMVERGADEVFRVDWALAFIAEEPEAALPKELRVACDYFVDDSAARLLAPGQRPH